MLGQTFSHSSRPSRDRRSRCSFWGAFLLILTDVSQLTVHLDARHTLARVACAVLVDVLWVAMQSARYLHIPGDIAVLVFVLLLCTHAVSLCASAGAEQDERNAYAITRALETALRERHQLLEDLFPPAVVSALVAGEAVPPLVTEGAVVLFCDLVGFTRMCSGMSPLEIMRAMNDVYSAFE